MFPQNIGFIGGGAASGGLSFQGSYDALANSPDLTTSPNTITTGQFWIVTVAGTFFGEVVEIGDWVVSTIDNPSTLSNWSIVQANINPANFWKVNGNAVGSEKWLGTSDNFDLPFRTNNTEFARLTKAGRFGIGTITPASKLEVSAADPTAIIGSTKYIDDSTAAGFMSRKARGTAASPTQVAKGDTLGNYGAVGYHSGGAFSTVYTGKITFEAFDNFTHISMPTLMRFYTTPLGSVTHLERATISADGNFGIGTANPNPSAILQADSTTKGFLAPRVTTAQKNAISAPPTSLFVFDADLGLFSYYTGSAWSSLSTSTTAWNIDGNVLGNDTTWIGSSDNHDVLFKTKNTERMRILKSGNVGIGISAPTAGLHIVDPNGNYLLKVSSLLYDVITVHSNRAVLVDGLTVGKGGGFIYENTAFGTLALNSNTTGFNNVAIGLQALRLNTTTSYNTAVGVYVLDRNIGNYNTGLGYLALQQNTTGEYNCVFGALANYQNDIGGSNCIFGTFANRANIGGSNNSIVGYYGFGNSSSGVGNTGVGYGVGHENLIGNYNVFIGNAAGYYETGSSKLFIDNTYRGSEADGRLKSLIYGVFDAATAAQYLNFNSQVYIAHDVTMGGELAHLIGVNRTVTAATAGFDLSMYAGGAVSGGTDKNGGNLIWKSGISTGKGFADIISYSPTPTATGTGDNTPTVREKVYTRYMVDNDTLTLENARSGQGWLMAGDGEEYAWFTFTSAGVVTLITNSANVTTTGATNDKINIYDGGTAVVIEQTFAAAKVVTVRVLYNT